MITRQQVDINATETVKDKTTFEREYQIWSGNQVITHRKWGIQRLIIYVGYVEESTKDNI